MQIVSVIFLDINLLISSPIDLSSGSAADALHDDEGGRGAAGDVLFVVGRVGLLGDPPGPAAVVGARRARLAAVDGRRVLPRRKHAPPVPQGALGQ